MRRFIFPLVAAVSMGTSRLSQMRCQHFANRQVFRTQDVPEIPEPSHGRKTCYILVIA